MKDDDDYDDTLRNLILSEMLLPEEERDPDRPYIWALILWILPYSPFIIFGLMFLLAYWGLGYLIAPIIIFGFIFLLGYLLKCLLF